MMKKMFKRSLFVMIAILMLGGDPSVTMASLYTTNYLQPEDQSGFIQEQYEVRMMKKLGRGVENFFLGWLEVPHGIKSEFYYREQEYLKANIEAFFIGTLRGAIRGFKRMGVGVYEAFTFPYVQEPILPEMKDWLY